MAITLYDWFYDGAQRRFLDQIVRAFSGFQYKTGRRGNEEPQLIQVPCRLASSDRVVSHIMHNLSENVLNTVPMITVWQTGLKIRKDLLQNPFHIDTRHIYERAIVTETDDDGNITNQHYSGDQGVRYTVQRMMPRPFEMTIQVDIWTSNLDQKHQLGEQILTVVSPTFDIQNSDNPIDWSSLSMAILDDVVWSSRQIPIGTQNEIDVMTLTLNLPVWLSPPAKVMQQKRIEQIVLNMHAAHRTDDDELVMEDRLSQRIITPGDHMVRVSNGQIQLLGAKGSTVDENGEPWRWDKLLEQYGHLRPTISTLTIKTKADIEDSSGDIVGTIQIDANDPSILHWQIDPDTLPVNTLSAITGLIEPLRTFPGAGLPAAEEGQRYLILQDIGPSAAWPGLQAWTNDIIEFNGTTWEVAFHPGSEQQIVLNNATGRQLRWTGTEWILAIDGVYAGGYWRINL